MITEDYVSFEIAKLLKEKGFDEVCSTVYETITRKHEVKQYCGSAWAKLNQIKRPTVQMAMKWLREVHHIIIVIQPLSFNGAKDFICDNWVYSVWLGVNLKIGESLKNQNTSSTYKEACEEAIRYSLENLI